MDARLGNLVNTMLKPLRNRVYNIVSRAVLEMANDSKKMQALKVAVLAGENRDDVEYFQDYGFTSVPLPGAEALVVCPQGNREHMIAVKVGNRTVRLKDLAEGEVAIYTDEGDKIHLKRGNNIEVVAATKVLVTTPEAEFSGNVKIQGNLTVIGTSLMTLAVTMKNTLTVDLTATIKGLLSALGYSGLAGAPVSSAVDITTTANMTGGGTDFATIKTTYNGHTHPETGVTTTAPNEQL